MSSAIQTSKLVKTYTGRDGSVEAVRGVDLEVAPGEVFGFLGPNGAGKSTTVRMLTTLMTITSGKAMVAGIDVTAEPHRTRQKIGVALQEAGLDNRQTGRELLTLQARLFGMSSKAAAARANELLELVELTDSADRMVKGYSGGMKRRLDLASALVNHPEILFLDEPTTGLDPRSKREVQTFVRELRDTHDATILLTTHDMNEAEALCDRIAIIDGGRIVALDTPQKLKALVSHNGHTPTLEDVFLELTGKSLVTEEDAT